MKRIINGRGSNRQVFAAAFVCLLLVTCAAAGLASEGAEGAHDAGHAAAQMKDFMWRVIDFAALFGILFWALKKADVKGALAGRRGAIEKTLRDAEEARQAAERKYAEYSEKLAAANREVDEIYAAIKHEGEAEKARIIAEAHAAADRIREQARQAAGQEVLKAKVELRAEAARLAVELAEQTLREQTKKDDQDRLVGEYLTKVVELH
jgi:F-type H+-transporting ATPase subunit b